MDPIKCIYLLFIALASHAVNADIYKVCSTRRHQSECDQIARSLYVECQENYHSVDCMLNIEQSKSHFGRVSAEEALTAANFVNNIVVIGEFRTSDAVEDDSLYSTVVLVDQKYTGGFSALKGKRYCHPGFKYDEMVSDLLLKEFETTVLKANNVDICPYPVPSDTLLEKELKAVSEFFGPSCRPGPFIDVEKLHSEFSTRYNNLCELCSNFDKCTVPSGTVPFIQSLNCLVNLGGDVALSTLSSVYEFFNRTENLYQRANYRFLCRDGSVTDNPCVWSKQPWDLIIANRAEAEAMKTNIQDWFYQYIIDYSSTGNGFQYEEFLKTVLFPKESQYNKIKILPDMPSLKDYLTRYRTIPTVQGSKQCGRQINWCTISETEQKKCEWLAQSSINCAVQPVLECSRSESKFFCLEDIKTGKVDAVTSDAHYGYIARKKNLSPLAYPETSPADLINTIIVIKDNDPNIQKLEHLKNKKSCFPEYAGIEWLSFIKTLRQHNLLSKASCDYDELLNEFVGDSCMPGAHDTEHEKSVKTNGEKFCSLCIPIPNSPTASTCNADENNKYNGNIGALQCLKEAGEFAVIIKGVYPSVNESEYRVLCKNGSLSVKTGFDVDEQCALSTIVDSEVVSKRDNPKNKDIGVLLINFERKFGVDPHKAFEVFNIFNSTTNLLFKDSTPGLDHVDSQNKYIRNYVDLFAHIDKCVIDNGDGNGSATTLYLSTLFMLIPVALFIID